MKIVSITELNHKKSKITLQDGTVFALYKGEIRRLHLSEGMELVQEQVEEIYHEILRKRIKERALYLLKAADKTEYEIRTKLKQAFYPEELIDYAVDFLKQYRYIDDQRYAQNYINLYAERRSRRNISQKLMQKGISRQLVNEILDERENELGESCEKELIYELLRKRKYNFRETDKKAENRMIGYLLRRGFGMDDILYCIRHEPEK